MESIDYKKLELECDQLIKGGKSHLVTKKLAEISITEIPNEFRLSISQLCARSGNLNLGLKILTPLVRTNSHYSNFGKELAQFGLLILRNGSPQEAQTIFDLVDEKKAHEVHLYRALARFANWEYQQSIANLEQYLANPPNPYMKLVGQVNMSSALIVCEEWERAYALISETISHLDSKTQSRLWANCHELRSQIFILKPNPDFSRAESDLEKALTVFAGEKSFDHLFVQKWLSVIKSKKEKNIQTLIEFQNQAQAQEHWESLREADRYILSLCRDTERFNKLLFGTPFADYKNKCLREMGSYEAVQESWVYGSKEKQALCFDLKSGKLSNGKEEKPGGKIHVLLDVLTQDLYKPKKIGGLFTTLFPGEHYDAFHSSHRVHQIIFRARRWFRENQIPLNIIENNGNYQIEISGVFAFLLSRERPQVEKNFSILNELKEKLTQDSFSAAEAINALNLSTTGFHRWITWAEKNQILGRNGQGKATRYFIATPEKITA